MDAPTRSLGPRKEYLLGLSEPPDGPPPSLLGRRAWPPLRPGARRGQHATLARPAALHRRGRALIAAVRAAAPRGPETAFALSVVGKPVRSVVSNHRAPLRGRILG